MGCDGTALGRVAIAFEAETRLYDVQAQVRRILAKFADGHADRVILVLADTRHNRTVLREARELLRSDFPLDTRVGDGRASSRPRSWRQRDRAALKVRREPACMNMKGC